LSNLESIQLGFNSEHVLTFQLNARQAGHRDPEIVAFYDRLRTEFASIPAVRGVTLSDSPLLGAGWSGTGVSTSGGAPKSSLFLTVGPDFFSTMQIPLLRGRSIEERDRPDAPYVAVVNEEFARTFFGTDDPIGKHVTLPRACATCDIEIVGVSRNVRYGKLKEAAPTTIFLSFSQGVWGPVGEATYQLRTAGNPLGVVRAVREIVERADPRVPPTRVKTQRALIDATINQEVIFARLCTVFALLALAIACVGLYGTMSYGVARRTSEIGVRMALGARRATVVWMVLREVLTLAAIALAVSVPVALTAAVLTMVGATLLAGYLPARNASRIDPMTALRHE
jgi:macrolide transport system ATP-binding/permease protein